MTNLFDALEICLQELEQGTDLDFALARFPEHAGELRPILETAIKARGMAPDEPSSDAVRRSRARVLQRAAELRESKAGARRRVIPAFSRLAISFALTALFLASGAGLVNVSASALPGENLYPVKRSWENIRLFFIFDPQLREMMRDEFENERLHEVNELLAEGRHELIQFAGVYMRVNGIDYVSGVKVVLPEGAPSLANGDAVIVSGRTNARGFIEISSIEILPKGSVVPLGNPIEVEIEPVNESEGRNANSNDDNLNSNSNDDNSNDDNSNGNSNDDNSNDDNSNGNSNENNSNDDNSSGDGSGGDDNSNSGDDSSDDDGEGDDNGDADDDNSDSGGGDDD